MFTASWPLVASLSDHTHWVRPRNPRFFLPEDVLSEVFRGKFHRRASAGLRFRPAAVPRPAPGPGPAQTVSEFYPPAFLPALGGLLQAALWWTRTGASLSRSLHASGGDLQSPSCFLPDDKVTFRWRDSAHKNRKRLLTLPVDEFLRRFLLHVLPRGFVRIRHFGFLASRRRGALLPLCRQMLAAASSLRDSATVALRAETHARPSFWKCPLCGGSMVLIERLTAVQIRLRSPPADPAA